MGLSFIFKEGRNCYKVKARVHKQQLDKVILIKCTPRRVNSQVHVTAYGQC